MNNKSVHRPISDNLQFARQQNLLSSRNKWIVEFAKFEFRPELLRRRKMLAWTRIQGLQQNDPYCLPGM